MYEVGDIVVCKNFIRNHNGIERDSDPNMIIGKSYEIIQIDERRNQSWDLQMLRIRGEDGPAWYWSDYFYNKTELRKFKLEKICLKLEMM